jgi:hypothetical protein
MPGNTAAFLRDLFSRKNHKRKIPATRNQKKPEVELPISLGACKALVEAGKTLGENSHRGKNLQLLGYALGMAPEGKRQDFLTTFINDCCDSQTLTEALDSIDASEMPYLLEHVLKAYDLGTTNNRQIVNQVLNGNQSMVGPGIGPSKGQLDTQWADTAPETHPFLKDAIRPPPTPQEVKPASTAPDGISLGDMLLNGFNALNESDKNGVSETDMQRCIAELGINDYKVTDTESAPLICYLATLDTYCPAIHGDTDLKDVDFKALIGSVQRPDVASRLNNALASFAEEYSDYVEHKSPRSSASSNDETQQTGPRSSIQRPGGTRSRAPMNPRQAASDNRGDRNTTRDGPSRPNGP